MLSEEINDIAPEANHFLLLLGELKADVIVDEVLLVVELGEMLFECLLCGLPSLHEVKSNISNNPQ